MLLVVASTLLVGARSQATTPPVGLVPIGGGCMAPEDCETQQCYFDQASQNSICVCNEETNAGCSGGETCGYPLDTASIFLPPMCLASNGKCEPWSFQNGRRRSLTEWKHYSSF